MTDSTDNTDEKTICGSTDTTSGEPCQRKADSCPYHGTDDSPKTRKTLLEKHPEIKDIIVGELANGATIREACAVDGVGISTETYYEWRRRAEEDGNSIFSDFSEETARARRRAARKDREELKAACRDSDDTRTWYKLHHDQYGDTYGEGSSDAASDKESGFDPTEEPITVEWVETAVNSSD